MYASAQTLPPHCEGCGSETRFCLVVLSQHFFLAAFFLAAFCCLQCFVAAFQVVAYSTDKVLGQKA